MRQSPQPDLAPPGAGIPAPEAWLAGVAIRLMSRLLAPGRGVGLFRSEAERCLSLARGLSEAQARRAVLIRRFPGIEDSSRHWSVYMTLQHLVTVGTAIFAGVPRLAAGRSLDMEVRRGMGTRVGATRHGDRRPVGLSPLRQIRSGSEPQRP